MAPWIDQSSDKMTPGILTELRELAAAEQAVDGQFIDVDFEPYLQKIWDKADWFVEFQAGKCCGFVAYYCNDQASRVAYITLLLVAPNCRGSGLGRQLVEHVMSTARRKGFTSCRLEVAKGNNQAEAFYRKLGFVRSEERPTKRLLEILL